jgi:hypothetical protein
LPSLLAPNAASPPFLPTTLPLLPPASPAHPPGKLDEMLIGGKPGRVAETNFGSYLAGLLVRSAQGLPNFAKRYGPVDIGLVNAGAIRADIRVGIGFRGRDQGDGGKGGNV